MLLLAAGTFKLNFSRSTAWGCAAVPHCEYNQTTAHASLLHADGVYWK